MQTVGNLLLVPHIIAGFLSLVLFWLPVMSKKGGVNHRKFGRWYVNCMWVVVVTAAILSLENHLQGNNVLAAFLAYLALITAKPLWIGSTILRNKHDSDQRYRFQTIGVNALLVASGMALIIYGMVLEDHRTAFLMYAFGGLGLSHVFGLVRLIRQPIQNDQWLRHHIVGMCTSGIAAHTAFLVIGMTRFTAEILIGYWALVPWIVPTIVGAIGIRIAVQAFRRKGLIPV